MKSFILSVVLTVTITAAVIINSLCANSVYDAMLDMLNGFPEKASADSQGDIRELSDYFEDKKYYLYLILPQCTVNELMTAYTETAAYCLAGDDSSYRASLNKTKLLLKTVKGNEGLRLYDFITRPTEDNERYFPQDGK